MLGFIKSWLIRHALPSISPAVLEQLAAVPETLPSHPVPPTPWITAQKDSSGLTLPQTIAHRGNRALFPENTLLALRDAVEQPSTSALETDLRMTKDGVIVLSHDESLKRVFGDANGSVDLSDADYDSLTSLRTALTPHEPLARFDELLQYLASPMTRSDVWVMLDIKQHKDMRLLMAHIANTIDSVPPHPDNPWKNRLVLGVWNETSVPLCTEFLPGFSVAHIGFSVDYARRFLASEKGYDNVSFNLLTESLLRKPDIIKDAMRAGRPVVAWTAIREVRLDWCIDAGLDGVITDDPKRFNELKMEWTAARRNGQTKQFDPAQKKFGRTLFDLMLWMRLTMFTTALKWTAETIGVRIDGTRIKSKHV